MAESVVSILVGNLNAMLIQEAKLLLGVSDEIRLVGDQLEWIRSFLKDADQKRHKNEMVNVLVNQIKDVAYNIEDIIDAYILKLEWHRQRNLALRLIFIPKKLYTVHTVGNQLTMIKATLEQISNNSTRYGFQYVQPTESSSTDVALKEKRAPLVEEADVVGFEKAAEKLANDLLARESQKRSVISIVGMGGLGKTTLAKYVYNRRDVMSEFQVRAWIYVSQEYRVRDLLLSTMKQVISLLTKKSVREMETTTTEELLRSKLIENLHGKRYLVVFDDIWATEAWDLIERAFPDDKNGSRIMLTTRNKAVALYANPSSNPHDLHLLNKDNSWNLFCKKVFPANSCPPDLEQLGKKIVAKAGGLPLAIVVLGGLISTKQKTHSAWQNVLQTADGHLTEDSNRCSQVLALSYNDLQYYLKPCFLYFGMFPEDVEIEADRLIMLWTAEGFIRVRGKETMEDVAEEYLEELIQRSMVQVARRRDDGSILSCRIHDLLRDFAISKANQDRFLQIHGSQRSEEAHRARRLTAHPGKGTCDTNLNYTTENLRSLLLCFNGGHERRIWETFYGRVKYLRVLDLCGIPIEELPKDIGDLILLKFLRLRGTGLRELPASIGNLIHLQTLDLTETNLWAIAPNLLQNMHKLRHLFCSSDMSKVTSCGFDWIGNPHVSNRIDHLKDLQTLELHTCRWINEGLEKLTNLRRLRLEGDLGRYSKVLSNALAKFERLRSLDLCESSTATPLPLVSFSQHMHLTHLVLWGPLEKIPNTEDFPQNLYYLRLSKSKLKESVDPMATLEKLPKLRTLRIEDNAYLGTKMACSRGGFANLHHLEISCLENLEEWMVEEGAMPNLKSLSMQGCLRLTVISESLKHISTLTEVEFKMARIENWWQQVSFDQHGCSHGGGEDSMTPDIEDINVDGMGGT